MTEDDTDGTPITSRRKLLAELSVVGVAGLAGCSGGGGDSSGTSTDEDTSTDGATDTPTETAPPTATRTSQPLGIGVPIASDIGSTTATLPGLLQGLGGASEGEVFFEYRQTDADEWQTSSTKTRSTPGDFSIELTGLEPETEYDYRAVVTTSDDQSAQTGMVSFTTQTAVVLSEVSDVTASGGTIALDVHEDAGGAEIDLQYRKLPDQEWSSGGAATVDAGGETIERSLSDLESRRLYEARAAVTTGEHETTTDPAYLGTLGSGEAADDSTYETAAEHHPADGFADFGAWLDDHTPVVTITEPTREQIEPVFHADHERLVVFETSGVVDLGEEPLRIQGDRCWVAGQTAPSPGITFARGRLSIVANDCVLQHVRGRHGPGQGGEIQSFDSINTVDETTNNVIDHVSASWGTDETLSVGYRTENTTVTNSLIYEGLYSPYGDESDHNYGTLVGNNAANVTLAGNVWAKTRGRQPRLKEGTSSVLVNNIMYFFGYATWMDPGVDSSIVGNLYALPTDSDPPITGAGNAYLEDNVVDPSDQPVAGESGLGDAPVEVDERPLWPEGLSALPSGEVETHNLGNAGARPADRTGNDARVVDEVRNRAGEEYLDSPYDYWVPDVEAAGGVPSLPVNTHSLDVPAEGTRGWLSEWAMQVETAE